MVLSYHPRVGGIVFPIMLNKLFVNRQVGFAEGVRACQWCSTTKSRRVLIFSNRSRVPRRGFVRHREPHHVSPPCSAHRQQNSLAAIAKNLDAQLLPSDGRSVLAQLGLVDAALLSTA